MLLLLQKVYNWFFLTAVVLVLIKIIVVVNGNCIIKEKRFLIKGDRIEGSDLNR